MKTHVQIRNLSKDVHRRLKIRADSYNTTFNNYVKHLIVADLEKPTLGLLTPKLRKRKSPSLAAMIINIIRDDRESH